MSIELKRTGNDVEVFVDGNLFTTCVNSEEYKSPFMSPVLSKDGTNFTRPDLHHREHPHQRSVFIGIGDVNGYDFWNEHGKPLGLIRAEKVETSGGGEKAAVSLSAVWQGRRGKRFLDEERVYTFSKPGDNCVRVDIFLKLTASCTGIKFGKTKEAGPLGIRVADEICADNGGSFVNSEGGEKEDGCWGKAARWCNYSGVVSGKKMGIAVFDDKDNERHPTAWHIRDYGLMAPNNLFFKGGYILKKGESVVYKFTLFFWEDSFDAEKYSALI
jgi:hypothetical protein